MKRQFVIETDTEFSNVFVYEVTQNYTATVNYEREVGVKCILMGVPGPSFYGHLDALLITADKIADAAPIEIEAV